MALTERELHWRLKKMTARLNTKLVMEARLAGIEIDLPTEAPGSGELSEMSPEIEAKLTEQLAATQERLMKARANGGSSR